MQDGRPLNSRGEHDSTRSFAVTDPEADGDWMNFGYAGAGEWARKVDEYSENDAYPLKAFDINPQEDVDLEADIHEVIDDKLPPENFYEHLDVFVIANRLSNHEIQFYHAVDNMPEDGLVVYEKALSPHYRSHEKMLNNDVVGSDDQPDVLPNLHYYKKPAVQKAGELVEEYDLEGISRVEVVTTEQRMDRPWILVEREGGIVTDFGSHAPELPIVALNGEFAEYPLIQAQNWDMNPLTENPFLDGRNEAFEARWALQGEKFGDVAYLDALVGKCFNQDRKQFLIQGEDPVEGEWAIRGYFGTDNNPPGLEMELGGQQHDFGLEDYPPAKQAVVDEMVDVAENGKEPELTAEDHAEIIRGIEKVNLRKGFFDDDLEMEDWQGHPNIDFQLL